MRLQTANDRTIRELCGVNFHLFELVTFQLNSRRCVRCRLYGSIHGGFELENDENIRRHRRNHLENSIEWKLIELVGAFCCGHGSQPTSDMSN